MSKKRVYNPKTKQYEEIEVNETQNTNRKGNESINVYNPSTKSFKDIAPTSSGNQSTNIYNPSTQSFEDIAPVKKDTNKWFKAGAFEDGYNFGDVTKTILGTGADALTKVGSTLWNMGGELGKLGAGYIAKKADDIASLDEKYGYNEEAEKLRKFAQRTKDRIAGKDEETNKRLENLDIFNRANKVVDKSSLLGDKSDKIVESIGQIGGYAAATAVGLGTPVMFGTAAGASLGENYAKENVTDTQAWINALAKGGIATLTEKAFGLFSKGKGIDTEIANKISSNLSSGFAKTLARMGVQATGEAAEEAMEYLGDQVLDLITDTASQGKGAKFHEDWNWEEVGAQMGNAFLSSLLVGAGQTALGVKNAQGSNIKEKVNEFAKQQDIANKSKSKNEQKVINLLVQEQIEEKNNNNEKVNKKEITEQAEKELEKGYVDIETIEKALGGDLYNQYQNILDQQEELNNKIETLENTKLSEMTYKQQEELKSLREKLENLNVEDIRKQLRSYVNSLTQNDPFLRNSYNEYTNKGNAYQVDLDSIDEKLRPTYERAMQSNILNNTNRTHDFVNLIAKLENDKGLVFNFTNNENLKNTGFALDGKVVNGYITDDGIFLNIDSDKALNSVVGHEITHALEGSELYDALKTTIKDYAKSRGEYEVKYNDLRELYKEVKDANIENEITADLVGDYLFTDEEFVKRLSVENRNLFQKIYDEIKYLAKLITTRSKEGRQLEKAKHLFEKVYRQQSTNITSNTKYNAEVLDLEDIPRFNYSEALINEIENKTKEANKNNKDVIYLPTEKITKYLTTGGARENGSFDNLVELIRDNGITEPIQLTKNKDGKITIYDGTHRLYIAKSMGLKEIPVSFVNVDNKAINDFVVANDVRYSISPNNIQNKINQSMTMNEAKKMIDIAFKENQINDWMEDNEKYKNADEWLDKVGIDDVAMYIENGYSTIENYLNPLYERDNSFGEDYTIEDIIEAYKNGTLTGGEKQQANRLDLTKESSTKDNRFYAPQTINDINKVYDVANQRVNNNNREEVYKARGDFVILAHNQDNVEKLGLNSKELNQTLKKWAAYPSRALELSNKLNENVAYNNKWSGLENSSILYNNSVSNEELNDLVKNIEGDSSNWQRNYITSTMLALDTHIDYKKLSFQFDKTNELNKKNALGDYSRETKTIRIGRGYQNTVAHEMGHYLDNIWAEDFGFVGNMNMTNKLNFESANVSNDVKQFANNFNIFMDNLVKSATSESSSNVSYYQDRSEVFARFVGRFVEWTKNTASGNRFGYEDKYYKDSFTQSQYEEFVKLLQEKSMLDTTGQTYNKINTEYSLSNQNEEIAPTGNYQVKGKDIKIQDIAPIETTEEVKETTKPKVKLPIEPTKEEAYENKKTRAKVREELSDEMNITTEDLDVGKDISSLGYQRTDPIRLNEKVFGAEIGEKINNATIRKTYHNEAERTRFLNKERQEIKNLGIKARSKESAAVQKYGEKQYLNDNNELVPYTDADLAREFSDVATQEKIKKAAKEIRNKYDAYIDEINKAITEMGYDPIPKRQDYMRHFQEIGDKLSQWGIPLNKESLSKDTLPTDINGVTDQFKPGKNWFASAMQRKGLKTTYDAITGIDGYLEGASNLIYHTADIQRYRALAKQIRDTYGQSHGLDNMDLSTKEGQKRLNDIFDNKLSKYAAWLDEQANALAGKKGGIDRAAERLLGRRIYTIAETAKKQVGSNMTGFNVRSALTNFASAVQGASKTNKMAFIKGTVSTIKNMINNDGLIEKSDFLTNRFGSDNLSKKLWQKASNAGQIFMTGTDYFTANQIWRGKYYENLDSGMSESEAIKKADDFASRIMGDRAKGMTAEIFNSKTLGLLSQFQLEVNNQWSSIVHDNKMDLQRGNKSGATVMFQLGQLAAMSYMFNNFMKAMTGSDVMIDPIDILKELLGWNDDDDEETTLEERSQKVLGDLVNDLPFVSFMTGGRIPIQEAFTGVGTAFNKITGQKDKYGNDITWENVKDDAITSAFYWLLPTGYGQLKKTSKGLSMYDENLPLPGSYTKSGNLRFNVEDTTGDKIKAALFGEYSSEEAQKYRENGYKTISSKKIQELKDLGMNASEYRKYSEDLKDAGTTNADKIDFITNSNYTDKQKNIMGSNVLKKDFNVKEYKKYGSYEEADYAINNPEKYLVSKVTTNSFGNYKKYLKEIGDIKADKDKNGKSINNSRKNKVIDYISNLNEDMGSKMILYKMQYPSDDTYNNEIVEYLNNKDNITLDQEKTILQYLGMTITDEGTVRW